MMPNKNPCPNCEESLGILSATSAIKVGSMVKHARCNAVLVIEEISTSTIRARLSTKAERGEEVQSR